MSLAKTVAYGAGPIALPSTQPTMTDAFGAAAASSTLPTDADEPTPMVGSVVADRYRIEREIGSGGMGRIYLAEHTKIGKKVALKILDHGLVGEEEALARFLREAKAASRIGHPNVCDVTDYGEIAGGGAFFAMQYLEGETLHACLRREQRLPWSRVVGIARQMLSALAAAHDRGIVHRDMKPANVFLLAGQTDAVKVLDFGIAKVLHSDPSGASVVTEHGLVMGTPRYMSPEQARGEVPDHRTDLYSVGVVLYELLTGTVPFLHDNLLEIIRQQAETEPRPLREVAPYAAIPARAEAIVLRALQKDRGSRYQTAREFIAALDEPCTEPRPAPQARAQASGVEQSVLGGGPSAARLIYLGMGLGVLASAAVGSALWIALG